MFLFNPSPPRVRVHSINTNCFVDRDSSTISCLSLVSTISCGNCSCFSRSTIIFQSVALWNNPTRWWCSLTIFSSAFTNELGWFIRCTSCWLYSTDYHISNFSQNSIMTPPISTISQSQTTAQDMFQIPWFSTKRAVQALCLTPCHQVCWCRHNHTLLAPGILFYVALASTSLSL